MSTDPGRAYLYASPSHGATANAKGHPLHGPERRASTSGQPAGPSGHGRGGQTPLGIGLHASPKSVPQQSLGQSAGKRAPGLTQVGGGLHNQRNLQRSTAALSSQSQGSADGSAADGTRLLGDGPSRPGGLGRWEAAAGNMEDARVALDAVLRAIDDAVYLDEDAFASLAPTTQYTRTIQAQQRRLAEARAEVDRVTAALHASEAAREAAEAHASDLQQELENNAVVFKMHFNELLAKDEEISRLSAVIQALSR